MKKKSLLLFLSMMVASAFSYGQNGLQQIIIEKYYVSNAADAANADAALSGAGYATGTLPSGSVTWRIYADLEPGWGVQGSYGEPGHPMVLTTSTSFFNHPNGNSSGGHLASNNAAFLGDGTTLLDSYLSCGGVAPGRFGVLKSEDNSAAVPAGGGANVVFSPAGILANVDPSAGLDINIADGHYNTNLVPTLLALSLLGDAASPAVNIFTDGSTVGGTFNTTNAYIGVLGQQEGAFPAGTNRVLIGQFTTKGILTYALNLQIRNTTTNVIQKYVSANATGSEIYMPSLSGILNAPTAYVIPSQPGVTTTPILTVGQTALNGYKMVGIPDGMGAYDNNNNTYTLLMSHELGNTVGVVRAHGAKGAFMSKWVINKTTNSVESGADLIQNLYVRNGASYVDSAYAMSRLCSGDLSPVSAFYNCITGLGTKNRIFLNGEETGAEGKAFGHIATGPAAGDSYELPYLGKFSWENAVASANMSNKTIVVGTDDATPGQVYVYVGTKTNSGTDIDKAGLSNGKLYGIAVSGLGTEVNTSFPAPGTAFSMADLGNVSGITGAALETASNAASVTKFLRPEDAVWDPKNPNDLYFVTTNGFTANSRLWKVHFNNINNPELGGTVTVLLDGTEGHKMLDNMTMDRYGNILLQEDVGNQAHIGKIWQYSVATDALKLIAEHDSAFFVAGGTKYLGTQDEESSGIFDATSLLGAGNFLFNVQAHYAIAGELVEGGQLLRLYNPDSYKAEAFGPNSSQSPYVVPAKSGVTTKAILTVGDTASNGYKMVGIPDGMGAYDNNNGTFTLLVNHELGNTVGSTRAHGAIGAFISKWTINKANYAVQSGSDLIQNLYIWNGTSYVDSAYAVSRLCSGDLPPVSAFYNSVSGLGTTNRIYMNGEETGSEGKAFGHIVTGPNAGDSYQLPYLGKFSWENAVACPVMSDKTLVAGTDDTTPGQVYFYIGTKTSSGTDIQKAGLANGKLYGVKVAGAIIESNAVPIAAGTAFSMFDLGNVSNTTGAALDAASITAGVTRFLRPEDGHFDPKNPSDFYFVTTNNITSNSRLWKLHFTNINNPELGGTIEALLTGNEGQKMMDNMTIDNYGQILVQEDVGNNAHLGKIWQYTNATDALELIATHDSARFLTGGSLFLTQDEESSGIIDASSILGAGNFIINDQAHYSIPGELVEGGQLLVLYNPGTANSCIATASSTTVSACSTYTWNGSTYSASGAYVFNTTNAAGCDSIATLNLTITAPPLWYADADNDSYGNPLASQAACLQPLGFVANTADCNDANAAINPAATELCNGIDDDCDGLIDGADINVAPLGPLGAITGTLVECKPAGSGSTTISVPAVPTAVNYSWTVPAGLNIVSGQGTTSIVVSWTSASIDPVIRGNVSVVAADACGSTSTSTAYLEYATTAPVTPASISGSNKACPGDVVTYSVATVFRASSYNWTVPFGMTITAGAGTNVISVSVSAGYAGGTVSVNATNVCGNSPVRTRLVSLNMPNTPGLISGPANGVCGSTGVVYSIATIANAASYNWTVPAGATIASGLGTNSITVNFSGAFTTGQLTVTSVNACGNSSARSLFVTSIPARPNAITGIVNPACGGQTYTYSVPTVIGTTSYNWVVTPGGTISFPFPMVVNGKDASITWTLGAPAIQGVSVSASNTCGTSPTRTASVTVNTCARVAENNIVWSVYPNPAKDRVTISFEATENAEYIVSMFDVTGRLVVRNQVNALAGNNTAELILSDLAAGVYSVVLQSTDAKSVLRLIVE